MPPSDQFDPNSTQAVLATIINKIDNLSTKQEEARVLAATQLDRLVEWQGRQDTRLERVEEHQLEAHGALRMLKYIGGAAVGLFSILEGYRSFFGGHGPLDKP